MNIDWEKIDQLFHQALECSDEERAEFIARAAQHDPALRKELQSLLQVHEENHSFMETPVMRVSLSPQFGRWQEQIVETLAPQASQVNQMIGRLLDGKYRLEELCGRGGMGAVYRALHVGTGRQVAVKVIAPELAGNREFIERFRREAQTIGRLRHPNIVNVTDFGITGAKEQTLAYLVMEHLEGSTLAVRLKDRRPVPLAEALSIINQTCAAIDEAHRQGVLHRDLKPENIWLEPVGVSGWNVKVLDFGIAQLQDFLAREEPESLPVISETSEPIAAPQPFSITEDETLRLNLTLQQLTRTGTVMGTPKYMSPEQCRGEKLDNASDIYSLGVLAYQMLSGELPFKGTVAELLQQHREVAPTPLREKRRDLPGAIDAVVDRALAKEPAARPATAGAFAFLLSRQTEGNAWLRQQADAINRQHRFKLMWLSVRLQWWSWLLLGVTLMATVKLPGLRPLQTGLVFGLLWLIIAATTLWKQNSVTTACTLLLEQTRKTAGAGTDLRSIVSAVKQRSGALIQATFADLSGVVRKLFSFKRVEIKRWADSLLLIPSLMREGVSVDEAAQRSAKLVEPLRRKLAYPAFRRLLAFALVLTAWQVMLVLWGNTLDVGLRRSLIRQHFDAMSIKLSATLVICLIAFCLSLKSSIEQAVLYFTARQALGEVAPDAARLPLRQDAETKPSRWWPYFKTYAPTCALLLLMCNLQFLKFPLMSSAMDSQEIYTIKALQAAGVPLPFWSLAGSPPTGLRRWLRRAFLPFGRHTFRPFDPDTLRSQAMTNFLLEKGLGANSRLDLGGWWTPPGIDKVTMPPLFVALTDRRVETARLLIAHGADLHVRDSIGRNALTVALTYCPAAIEMLHAHGVDLNEPTRFGPPLLAAARYQWLYPVPNRSNPWHIDEHENAVKILLEKGVDPNTRDSEGRNALMVMSMERRMVGITTYIGVKGGVLNHVSKGKIIMDGRVVMDGRAFMEVSDGTDKPLQLIGEALLQAGCDLDAADSNGRTPLMYAMRYNQLTAVRLLLEYGADVKAKDKSGLTALDLAKQSGNKEIIRLLQ